MLFDLQAIDSGIRQLRSRLAHRYDLDHLDGPQGKVVLYLNNHPNKVIYQKDIEEEFGISKSVASQLMKRMVRNGFIEIEPSESDKRYKEIHLSKLGQEKSRTIKDFLFMTHNVILDGISSDEVMQVEGILAQLMSNIQRMNDILDEEENNV